ncbi:hypothetical protein [Streptomyces sp. NPDC048496]|uniref:hypothetical protein n=1 Tax=Streptomyces sp. NPDC048496 TaxID=3365558 RepID=UPI0037164740
MPAKGWQSGTQGQAPAAGVAAATAQLIGVRRERTVDDIDRNATVLYAHLGGQPALNGYSALFS